MKIRAALSSAVVLTATLLATAAPAVAEPVNANSKAAAVAKGWANPVNGKISGSYGWRTHPATGKKVLHDGTDVAAKSGTLVRAAAAGTVQVVNSALYGPKWVIVTHANGVKTRYGHMSTATVKPGAKVAAGQKIGTVGAQGNATGPHLHLTVVVDGKTTDPVPFLSKRGVRLGG